MTSILKQKIIFFVEFLHLKIFGHEMGDEMRRFVGNLGWMGVGSLLSGIFIFAANLAAGRLLGPGEYGKYSIIISIGQLFIIPMLFGINTASMRYVASNKDEKEKIISTANLSVIFLGAIIAGVIFLFRHYLQGIFKVDNAVLIFTVMYSFVLAIKYNAEATIKGLHQFKFLSKLNVISAFFIFISFFVIFFLAADHTFRSYSIASIVGLLIFFLVILFKNKIRVAHFELDIFRKIMHYGIFASIGSISGFALNNIDRIVLNNYLGFSAVGLFAAYFSAASFFSGQLLQVFIDVFFPSVSAARNKKIIYTKIKKIFYFSFLPLLLLNATATTIIIKLYGSEYRLSYMYVILFSLLGVLTFYQNTLWWFIASFGKKGVRFTSITGIFIGAFNIVSIISLVKLFGFIGAVYGLNLTSVIMLATSIIYLRKIDGKVNQ